MLTGSHDGDDGSYKPNCKESNKNKNSSNNKQQQQQQTKQQPLQQQHSAAKAPFIAIQSAGVPLLQRLARCGCVGRRLVAAVDAERDGARRSGASNDAGGLPLVAAGRAPPWLRRVPLRTRDRRRGRATTTTIGRSLEVDLVTVWVNVSDALPTHPLACRDCLVPGSLLPARRDC